ncbi:MAG: hypothetical protein IH830_03140 [Planctomycetes bacterium]|nr:hypothetical protein [Planctomycetota bacterium]
MGKRKRSAANSDAKTYLPLYAAKVASPEAWIATARELMAAAAPLQFGTAAWWEACRARFVCGEKVSLPTNVQGVYFVLIGYVIENLAKAMIVGRESTVVRRVTESAKGIPEFLKTHKLFGLVKRIRLPLQNGDEDLLRRLTRYSVWAGRYPVPVTFEDASHGEEFEDGKEYHVAYISGEDAEKANDLVIRLARHLYTEWRSTNLCNWIEELEGVQATPDVS